VKRKHIMRTETKEFLLWPIAPYGGDNGEGEENDESEGQSSSGGDSNSGGANAGNAKADSEGNKDEPEEEEDDEDEFEGLSAKDLKLRLKEATKSNKATAKEKAELQKKIDAEERKKLSVEQQLKKDAEEAIAASTAKDAIIEKQAIRQGILMNQKFIPHDPEDIYLFIDKSEITVNEDGVAEGLETQLKDLARRKPHLFKKSGKDDNNDGDNNGRRGPTGTQPGQGVKVKTDANAKQKSDLQKLYPALANR